MALVIFLSFCLAGLAKATDYAVLGGDLNVNFLVNATGNSLLDSADSIYLGALKSETNLGFGGEASLFYSVAPSVKAGPHFIFNYSPLNSTWHAFQLFQASLGGIVDFELGGNSVSAYLDYNLGWFNAQQEISSVAGSPSPAGDFSGGIPGFLLGVKTRTNLTETIGLGVYYQFGSLTLAGIKYKNSSNQTNWMDAGISFSQFGVTIYL
ncbi:hypothetical protein A2346_04260 [candidate division WOR-1 bacterium RIFOXYB12_FULL_52_16]|nr:MAG: hypothetical protein A2346_04260 [candidate division WOR-1 bacterium RIFOXYB12_FULL_52_16]